ncbi:sensor domain-containing diguanylate cyclase [Alteromonas sp. 5E99-2]|nr:sensor domain-containing diguanylate cyclase [Alteromonas sp. 5E99-2]
MGLGVVSSTKNFWAEKRNKPRNASKSDKVESLRSLNADISDTDSITLSMTIDALNVAALVLSPSGRILKANISACRLLSTTKNHLYTRNMTDIISSESRREYISLFEGCSCMPSDTINHGPKEVQFACNDGHIADIDLSITSIKNQNNGIHLIAILHDLTVHKVKQQKLQKLANIDTLTELFNRRAFSSQYGALWQTCIEEKEPISLLMIDVDYFKKFNDKYGHLNGDECLKKISKIVSTHLPTSDSFATRYGGEEFIVLLPRSASNIATRFAENLLNAIKGITFEDIGLSAEVNITVSIGIAQTLPSYGDTKEQLIKDADDALLIAKQQGKNKIVIK